jgi:hypothetical protein
MGPHELLERRRFAAAQAGQEHPVGSADNRLVGAGSGSRMNTGGFHRAPIIALLLNQAKTWRDNSHRASGVLPRFGCRSGPQVTPASNPGLSNTPFQWTNQLASQFGGTPANRS